MRIPFLEDCAADDCHNKNLGRGRQLCKEHQQMYDDRKPFKAFYGRTLLKKSKDDIDQGTTE